MCVNAARIAPNQDPGQGCWTDQRRPRRQWQTAPGEGRQGRTL